jgi:MFS family permease
MSDQPRQPWWRTVAGVAVVDTSPLRRHRQFRLLTGGQLVALAGSELTAVAIPYQVYRETHSSLAVGLVSLVGLICLLIAAPIGGSWADKHDRRTIALVFDGALALVTTGLVINSLAHHPSVIVLFVLSGAVSTLYGLQRPSTDAMVPRIVPIEDLKSATILSSIASRVGAISGPPIAGLLIAVVGLPATYAINVATFAISLAAFTRMAPLPSATPVSEGSTGGFREGLRYAMSQPVLIGTYLVDINAMFFGMPTALFPATAAHLGGPGVLGLLYAAPEVGALVVNLTSGWAHAVHRHGRAVIIAATIWGVGIVGFGLAPHLGWALAALILAGGADMASGIFRSTIWNETVPDDMRGRMSGLAMLSWSTGPALGGVESGLVAELVGLRASIISGGLLCVVGTGILAAALPTFRRYDARQRPSAQPPEPDGSVSG